MTLQTLIKFIFGSIIILFVIWNRFLRNRENTIISFYVPKELLIISYIALIVFFIIIFVFNMKKILKINKQSKIIKNIVQKDFVQKTVFKIREYIFDAPEFLYKEVTKNKDLGPLLEKPGSYFTFYCNYPKLIVITFLKLPIIIIATVFLISSVFYQNLEIFLKCLLILIPMLFMRVWLFLLTAYSTRRLNHIYEFLTVTYIASECRFKLELKPDNQLPQSLEFPLVKIKHQFPVFCNLWEIYSSIYTFMKGLESYRNRYNPYVQVYISLCYIIGWMNLLFIE